jgi:hypothetical protein
MVARGHGPGIGLLRGFHFGLRRPQGIQNRIELRFLNLTTGPNNSAAVAVALVALMPPPRLDDVRHQWPQVLLCWWKCQPWSITSMVG